MPIFLQGLSDCNVKSPVVILVYKGLACIEFWSGLPVYACHPDNDTTEPVGVVIE